MSVKTQKKTHFAPAKIYAPEVLEDQKKAFLASGTIPAVLNAIPDVVMILNDRRQLVLGNSALEQVTGRDLSELTGSRPGEILNCVHAQEDKGCGTTPFCRYCGAARAIVNSLKGNIYSQECRILRRAKQETEALDLRVAATPLTVQGYFFSAFHLTDISHEKRREILERIFFHDILNSTGGVQGILQMLAQNTDEDNRELAELADKQCQAIVEQIQAQKDIMAAEKNDLELYPEKVGINAFLQHLRSGYSEHLVAREKEIRLRLLEQETQVVSDPRILYRVLGNMLKNALEASGSGETVTMGAEQDPQGVLIWVHNNQHMSEEVRSQIFKRSFSTKGRARGLGTYSIRLLSERYLRGEVWFESAPEKGTIFYLRLNSGMDSF